MHNLELNNNKTHLIQFHPYQKPPLNLNTVKTIQNIREVQNIELLGINIDTHLNWKAHINKIKSKISKFIYALSVFKVNTHSKCALTAYYA
jgi:hypothetical protein